MNLLSKYLKLKHSIAEATEHPMIEHNGKMVHRNNSEGNPIHHTDDGIKNFHNWFGDSDSTDEHGRPKVMHHSVPALSREQDENTPLPFKKFEKTNSGVFSFAEKHDFAERYAQTKSQDAQSDHSPFTFKTYIKTKTFDPKNDAHVDAVKKHLPDNIPHSGKYGWSAWGGEKNIPKDEFFKTLKGTQTEYNPLTKELHSSAAVGKSLSIDGGNVYVHHKDENSLWVSDAWKHSNIPKEQIDAIDKHVKDTLPDKYETKVTEHQAASYLLPKKKDFSLHKISTLPKVTHDNDNWEYTENDHLKDAFKKAGFNAIKQTERKHTNTAVIDSTQIKSATHNNGQFNTNDMEIDK